MSEADKRQEGGSHYRTDFWQTWNLIIPMGWSAFQFEIINYLDRYQRKGGIEDLRKARHWLDKLIEVEEEKLNSFPLSPIEDLVVGDKPKTPTPAQVNKAIENFNSNIKHTPLPPQYNGQKDEEG